MRLSAHFEFPRSAEKETIDKGFIVISDEV